MTKLFKILKATGKIITVSSVHESKDIVLGKGSGLL